MREAPVVPGRWRRALRLGWLLAVAVAVGLLLADRWKQVGDGLAGMSTAGLVASTALAFAGVGLSCGIWRAVLTGLGAPLSPSTAARVFFLGQLGKYLPGSIWPAVAQAEMGRDLAVPPRSSAAAVALFLWTHLLSGVAVSAVALAASGVAPAPVAVCAVPALALLAPGLQGRAVSAILRLLRRPPLPRLPDRAAVMSSLGWALAMWLCYGAHVLALASGVGFARATGAFAAAWCAGFVFVVAPAGAGVREGVLVALLGGLASAPALSVALVSRLVLTAADVVWAGLGVLIRLPPADRTCPRAE